MAKVAYTASALTIAEVEAAIAAATSLSVAVTAELAYIDQLITQCGLAASTWEGRTWWWLGDTGLFQTNTKTIAAAASDGAVRASNVATITTTAVHGLAAGQFVKVAVTDDSTFNGIWKVASAASTTTFTYAQVGDDVAAATAGSGTICVVSYPLRSIDLVGSAAGTATMGQARTIERVYYDDDRRILPLKWRDLRNRMVTLAASSTASQPTQYCIYGDAPQLFLWPAPASNYNIHLDFIKRHSAITGAGSTDAALIVPGEWHWPVYVEGAIWLRKHRTEDVATLRDCPAWVAAMQNMATSNPDRFDEEQANLFNDAIAGSYPSDRRVIEFGDGGYAIEGTPSI